MVPFMLFYAVIELLKYPFFTGSSSVEDEDLQKPKIVEVVQLEETKPDNSVKTKNKKDGKTEAEVVEDVASLPDKIEQGKSNVSNNTLR